MIEDPLLLKATRRDSWRPGSVVEIFNGQQWSVGWIHSQENSGYVGVLIGDSNQKVTMRLNDPSLAVIGTHCRLPPPGWEVRPRGPNGPQLTSRYWQCSKQNLEAAWATHIELSRNKGAPHAAGRPDGHLAQGKGSPAASPQHVPLHSSARQAMTNGETQVSSMSREELLQLVGKLQEALSEAQKQVEQGRLSCEAKDEKMHQLIYERNAMQAERDEARHELESLRTQHGVAHRSASQTSLPSAPQSMVVSPGLQPSSSAKCIKPDAALPPVPNSWQPPQSARDGKCISPVSPVSGGPEETEDGDMFPEPDFSGSYRAFGPMATVPQVPAVPPNPGRGAEKLVDILVTVPRANGPEDLDMSNYEHFKDHRFHEPSRSLQSLQKNMQPPPPHTVQRLPSAPVHSQAYPGQVAFPHVMHPQFRIVTSASASVPSAPASLAAPAGGVRLAPRPSLVAMAAGYAVR